MHKPEVVFFGSGPVAEESLSSLANHFNVEAVVTKPSTKDVMEEIVKTPVYAAADKDELNKLFLAKPFKSAVGIVVDFGIIVDQPVIDYFPLGIVNSHFSLLPRWRGADPITFAILEGDDKTGVSLMLIEKELDTGKLIAQKGLKISADDTTPTLTHRLIALSNQMLEQFLPKYVSGDLKPRSQPHPSRATYSRKLTKDDSKLDFNKPAEALERQVRAFAGWPGSRMTLAGKDVLVTKACVSPVNLPPGKVELQNKTILVGTTKGSLIVERLKPAGKNEMTSQAFLAGHKHLL